MYRSPDPPHHSRDGGDRLYQASPLLARCPLIYHYVDEDGPPHRMMASLCLGPPSPPKLFYTHAHIHPDDRINARGEGGSMREGRWEGEGGRRGGERVGLGGGGAGSGVMQWCWTRSASGTRHG